MNLSKIPGSQNNSINLFYVEVGFLPHKTQEEFLELKCNSDAKDNFETTPLTDFWARDCVCVYRNIGNVAMRILLSFSAIYTV